MNINTDNPHDRRKHSGFEPTPDLWRKKLTCHHPSHQPPTMIVIPPGKQYRHVCPGCGQTTILRGSDVTLSA